MSRFFPNAKRSLDSLLNLITDLVADGLLFFNLMFRSRTALSAEVLFLRNQLAFYEERQVPTETIDRLRPFLSHPLVSPMQLERGPGNRETRDADRLASHGSPVVWKMEVASWSATASWEHPQTHRARGTRESNLGTSAGYGEVAIELDGVWTGLYRFGRVKGD
jgi:hypothetical protein